MYHENHPDSSYEMANRVLAFELRHVISWQPGYVSPETGQLSGFRRLDLALTT